MTNFKLTEVTIAGITLKAVKDGDFYGVLVTEYQEMLGLSPDFTRNSKRGKSPEVLQEAGVHTELRVKNYRVGRSTTAYLDTKDFISLLGVFAKRGNDLAFNWILALANETIERRIDVSIGDTSVTEATREDRALKHFRELFRSEYKNKVSSWGAVDGIRERSEYAQMVNEIKLAVKLPINVTPDKMTEEQCKVYYDAINAYNTLRNAHFTHHAAVRQITQC